MDTRWALGHSISVRSLFYSRLVVIVKWDQNQNDQTVWKKESEKRMREERLVSESILSFFSGKLGCTDTFIINKAEFKILNSIVLKIGLFGAVAL